VLSLNLQGNFRRTGRVGLQGLRGGSWAGQGIEPHSAPLVGSELIVWGGTNGAGTARDLTGCKGHCRMAHSPSARRGARRTAHRTESEQAALSQSATSRSLPPPPRRQLVNSQRRALHPAGWLSHGFQLRIRIHPKTRSTPRHNGHPDAGDCLFLSQYLSHVPRSNGTGPPWIRIGLPRHGADRCKTPVLPAIRSTESLAGGRSSRASRPGLQFLG
jgi:hypothetical protein